MNESEIGSGCEIRRFVDFENCREVANSREPRNLTREFQT